MDDIILIECAQSVYDHLMDDTNIKDYNSFEDIPAFKRMNDILSKHGFITEFGGVDMIGFTSELNDIFEIYEVSQFRNLLRDRPRDFFSKTKSRNFYRTILRELKLSLIV